MDSSEHSAPPRPTPEVGRRVEELLREQLEERGVNPRALLPEEISRGMECRIAPDNSRTYFWKGEAILHVTPEVRADSVLWRMFTRDDMPDMPSPDPADHV